MYTSKEMQVVAVTNRSLCHRPFPEQLEMVCQTHPAFIILREKDLPAQEYEKLAAQVLELCHSYEVPCVLHTYRMPHGHLAALLSTCPFHFSENMHMN